MIITIRVTEAAIDYLRDELHIDEDLAGEVAQMIVNLCEKSGSETPRNRERDKNLLGDIRSLLKRYEDDSTFESHVRPIAINLENSLDQFFSILEEEERREKDTLFKTADSMMRYYAEAGAQAFRSRFGSLDVLEVCRKIIQEGEGNPHPWEHEK